MEKVTPNCIGPAVARYLISKIKPELRELRKNHRNIMRLYHEYRQRNRGKGSVPGCPGIWYQEAEYAEIAVKDRRELRTLREALRGAKEATR